MKKIFRLRVFILTFCCFTSLIIKSESSICKLTCTNTCKNLYKQSLILLETHEEEGYPYDGLFIKI
ncbi:hypothetical protein FW778_21165 [Ginsengibacter hankyongi]|uniref:Uncharacterized protein n=1 Tax=Ginsengibacter hankyongi TaxID=2607284 RepID=A0A5J5IFC4_9BACT|nr:hypothetical protein [Ginsengibacter hankyongi]KAA9035473.1 hypothetical protein FW778_21165 [Ginsengibacter hankyongi]